MGRLFFWFGCNVSVNVGGAGLVPCRARVPHRYVHNSVSHARRAVTAHVAALEDARAKLPDADIPARNCTIFLDESAELVTSTSVLAIGVKGRSGIG